MFPRFYSITKFAVILAAGANALFVKKVEDEPEGATAFVAIDTPAENAATISISDVTASLTNKMNGQFAQEIQDGDIDISADMAAQMQAIITKAMSGQFAQEIQDGDIDISHDMAALDPKMQAIITKAKKNGGDILLTLLMLGATILDAKGFFDDDQ